jgi:2-polyprenyl-6-methoxyphenol hydroxylase-like FAD-dependent oxidoreductase
VTTMDVVIAGGGPTGLMLASELRLGGAEVIVLEQLPTQTGLSKALGLAGRAVQTFNYRGLLERFDAGFPPGVEYSRFLHFGGIPLDLGRLVASAPPGYFPPGVPAKQAQVEAVLEGRARELGAQIRRGHEVVGLFQNEEYVTLDVRGPDGPYRLTARYVVGCDGARSLVRRQAGIGFPGTQPTLLSRLGDVTLDKPEGVPIGMVRTAAGGFASVPFGEGVYRIVTTEPGQDIDRDSPPTLDELQASVRRVLGVDLAMSQPRWLSRFTDAARQADRYRAGRVLVAGDAAHIQLPAGGPGMTTGLQDAANLGWKLAGQIGGWAPPGLLDTYHAERHPVAERMLWFTRAQGVLLTPGDHVNALRDLMGNLFTHEQTLRYVVDRLLGLDIRYDPDDSSAHRLVGGWAPDLALTTEHGDLRLATLMHAARPVLVDLTPDGRLRDAAAAWEDRVETTVARSDEPLDAVLMRPDGYVAWAAGSGGGDASGLRRALVTWFGAATDRRTHGPPSGHMDRHL